MNDESLSSTSRPVATQQNPATQLPTVLEALDGMGDRLTLLAERVDVLARRLEPVSTPQDVEAPREGYAQPAGLAPAVERIFDFGQLTRRITLQVDSTLDRLAL